jgi:ribonuclease III
MTKKRKFQDDSAGTPVLSKKLRSEPRDQQALGKGILPSSSSNGRSQKMPALPPITAAMSKVVFTHQSLTGNKSRFHDQSASYERLEFLGDAYIELMASRLVWDRFKDLPAGRLSQIRETLVKNETLGEIVVRYGLDKQLSAAPDVRLNAKKWAKVKGDLLEAYVAAVVSTDKDVGGPGYKAAEHWLHQLWIQKLGENFREKPLDIKAKDALSRKVVSRNVRLEYTEEQPMEQLDAGQQTFFVGAYLTGWGYKNQLLGRGQALTKTGAGNLAAANALQNPLTEQIAVQKRTYDCQTKLGSENGKVVPESTEAENSATQEESGRRERELVEKKRSIFMKTEFET